MLRLIQSHTNIQTNGGMHVWQTYIHICTLMHSPVCVCVHTLAHILNLLACVPARGKGRATATTMRCYSTTRNKRRANCRSGRERDRDRKREEGRERWGEETRCGTGATVGATDVNVIKEIIVTMSAAAAAASPSPSSSQWRHQYKLISDRHEQRQQQQYNNNSASSSSRGSNNNNNDTIERRDGRWVVVRSVVLSAGLTSWRINNLRWIQKEREGEPEQVHKRAAREREFCQCTYTRKHMAGTFVCVCLFAAVCPCVCVCVGENQHISEFFWKFNKYKNFRPVLARWHPQCGTKEERGCLNSRRTINKIEIKISTRICMNNVRMYVCVYFQVLLFEHTQLESHMCIVHAHAYRCGYMYVHVCVNACVLLLAPLTPTR